MFSPGASRSMCIVSSKVLPPSPSVELTSANLRQTPSPFGCADAPTTNPLKISVGLLSAAWPVLPQTGTYRTSYCLADQSKNRDKYEVPFGPSGNETGIAKLMLIACTPLE